MWKNVLLASALLLSLFLSVALFVLAPPLTSAGNQQVSYADFLSISLTAVTVLLAVFGLMVAYIAFMGRKEIERRACEIAAAKAEETILNNPDIKKLIDSLSDDLRQHVDGRLKEEGNKVYGDIVSVGSAVDLSVPPDAKEDTND